MRIIIMILLLIVLSCSNKQTYYKPKFSQMTMEQKMAYQYNKVGRSRELSKKVKNYKKLDRKSRRIN